MFHTAENGSPYLEPMLKYIVEELDPCYFPFKDKGKLLELLVFLIFNGYRHDRSFLYILSKMDVEKHYLYFYYHDRFYLPPPSPLIRNKPLLNPVWLERTVPLDSDEARDMFGDGVGFVSFLEDEVFEDDY